MKRVKMLAISMAAAVLLSGCSKFSPKETAVSVGKDGVITAAVIEELDQDYYKEEELKSSIDQAVADYTAKNGKDSVKVEKYETEERKVTLFMEYENADVYAKFNHVKFYAGDVAGARGAGFEFEGTFQGVEKGELTGKEASGSEAAKDGGQVLILEEQMSVEVPGNILYVSSNVEVTGKKSAKVKAPEKAESEKADKKETETETETQTEVPMLAPAEDQDGETQSSKEETEAKAETEEETKSAEESAIAYIIYG